MDGFIVAAVYQSVRSQGNNEVVLHTTIPDTKQPTVDIRHTMIGLSGPIMRRHEWLNIVCV